VITTATPVDDDFIHGGLVQPVLTFCLFSKGGVEVDVGGLEVDIVAEVGSFFGALVAIHSGVFPFNGEWSVVVDGVQSPDDFFEADPTSSDAAEVPTATGIAEADVAGEDAGATVQGDGSVFHVNVVDTIREVTDEFDRVDALPDEVAGVEVETEFFAVVDRFQSAFGGIDVEGDFGRMDFETEFHTTFLEDVHDGIPEVGEELESVVDHALGCGWEVVEQVPDAGSGEPVDGFDVQFSGSAGGVFHFFDGTFTHTGRITVTPDVFGEDRFVSFVDVVTDSLSDEVVGDGEKLQVIFFEQFAFPGTVGVVSESFVDFEVITPARQFQTVVTEFFCFLTESFQGKIGPLTCKQSDRTCHRYLPL